MKRTKIVATIGPASAPKETLAQMVKAGVDVIRLNFSHAAYDAHKAAIENIRAIDKELGTNTAILADLQGPKLRIGEVENNGVELVNGASIVITTTAQVGTAERV